MRHSTNELQAPESWKVTFEDTVGFTQGFSYPLRTVPPPLFMKNSRCNIFDINFFCDELKDDPI